MIKNSYNQYLLRYLADIEPFIRKIGEIQFQDILKQIDVFVKKMPIDGTWVNFLQRIPDDFKPDYIRCWCYYISTRPFNAYDVIGFNNTVTMVRRITHFTVREECEARMKGEIL